MASIFKFKGNTIFPKMDHRVALPKIKKLFLGGFIPTTLNPGTDPYAYDHMIVGDYYTPAPPPSFDLSLMQKRERMAAPEIPQVSIDLKKGHYGSIESYTNGLNKLHKEYYDLIKDNPDINAHTYAAKQKRNEIAAYSSDLTAQQKLVNEKETNDKKGQYAMDNGFDRKLIVHNGQVPVYNIQTGQKEYLSSGQMQDIQNEKADPSFYTIINGQKQGKYIPFGDRSLHKYAETNVLKNVYDDNMHPEIGGGLNDKMYHEKFNHEFKDLGDTETLNKSLGNIVKNGPLVFMQEITSGKSSNNGQVQAAIRSMRNSLGPEGESYIESKILANNGVMVKDDKGNVTTLPVDLNDPQSRENGIMQYIAAGAYSKLKNDTKYLVDTKEGSDRMLAAMGINPDMKLGMRVMLANNMHDTGVFKRHDSPIIKYPTASGVLATNDMVMNDEQHKALKTMATNPEFHGATSALPIVLPYNTPSGNHNLKNPDNAIPISNTLNYSILPYEKVGDNVQLLFTADKKKYTDVEGMVNDLAAKREQYQQAVANNTMSQDQYTASVNELVDGYNKKLADKGMKFGVFKSQEMIVKTSENEFEKLQEANTGKGFLPEEVLSDETKKYKQYWQNTFEKANNNLSGSDKLVKTTGYQLLNRQGDYSLDSRYKQNTTSASDATIISSVPNQHKHGGKIMTFVPITLNDIE